ncbi:MAG: pentapeptide repeat-containing protein, partial [Tolypothrix sp. T3-bin4]|nr:pentapeptide repeat-containing protein [Tolypothrix sp. T3-bin4]
MNLRTVIIVLTLLAAATLPIAVRLSVAENMTQPLRIKPLENIQKAVQPLKAKKIDVALILKTKRCVGCDLREINLSGLDLSGADLRNTDLSRANLKNTKLKDAKMSGARLNQANLTYADLDGADFQESDFKGADLS